MNTDKTKYPGYKIYLIVFLVMLVLLTFSVGLSKIDLGPFTVFALMMVAIIQCVILLAWSMHLRFDQKIYTVFVIMVLLVFISVVVITFLDYLFR